MIPRLLCWMCRTRSETAMGMLPGAINIPLNELEANDQLDKRKRIVLVSKEAGGLYRVYET